ncbi:MAG: transposase [Verrucomicrobiae bacterium]|nr:transposase [Verrucomicrobiae bacterium]
MLALYWLRWQVELVIKRLKSIAWIEHLRARGAVPWPISISTANCFMPGCWNNGPDTVAAKTGIA